MAMSLLVLVGVVTAVFVGLNIGGSSTGVAFGPAAGSGVISKRFATVLMALFVFAGAVTVGPNVVDTLGHEFVPLGEYPTAASIGVLAFTGIGILLGNVMKVSVSTSETAVGAIVGMGAALGVLDWGVVATVVSWWVVSAVIAFWVSAVVGRYLYDRIVALLDLESGGRRGTIGNLVVVAVGCFMAFSAGASNLANAVAPLVGSGELGMTGGVILGASAIGVGGFILGPRTMETVGEGITDLPVEAALVVEVIAATIITGLSWGGIPASLAITATMSVIGLGWGRASKHIPLSRALDRESLTPTERAVWRTRRFGLYDVGTTRRVVLTWLATPTTAGILAVVAFQGAEFLDLL